MGIHITPFPQIINFQSINSNKFSKNKTHHIISQKRTYTTIKTIASHTNQIKAPKLIIFHTKKPSPGFITVKNNYFSTVRISRWIRQEEGTLLEWAVGGGWHSPTIPNWIKYTYVVRNAWLTISNLNTLFRNPPRFSETQLNSIKALRFRFYFFFAAQKFVEYLYLEKSLEIFCIIKKNRLESTNRVWNITRLPLSH